jgi:transcription elongation factor GreA
VPFDINDSPHGESFSICFGRFPKQGGKMYDELTEVDIKKMEEEIEYRKVKLAPELGAELKRTREFGDLSENAEYKEAKRAKRKNEGRIRYLENMIRTAKVIEIKKADDEVGLFDRVLIFNEKMNAEKEIQIVTTLRQNALQGFVSKESPLGSALMGKKNGDRVLVKVNDTMSYYVKILEIEKGEDNTDLPISGY